MAQKLKSHQKRIKTRSGDMITVDISDEACMKFGFKHGDEIIDPHDYEAKVAGVAYVEGVCGHPSGDALWYNRKQETGASVFNTRNLREAGAILKSEKK